MRCILILYITFNTLLARSLVAAACRKYAYMTLEPPPSGRKLERKAPLFIISPRISCKYTESDHLSKLNPIATLVGAKLTNEFGVDASIAPILSARTCGRLYAAPERLSFLNYGLSPIIKASRKSIKSYASKLNSAYAKLSGKIISLLFYSAKVISLVGAYLAYNFYLPDLYITFPFQLIPNDLGLFNTIGLDTAASIAAALYFVKTNDWEKLGRKLTKQIAKLDGSVKKRLLPTAGMLVAAYSLSGRASFVIDRIIDSSVTLGSLISPAMSISLQVLISHFLWIASGSAILSKMVGPFFPPRGKWYSQNLRDNWMAKSIVGYMISTLVFSVTDTITTLVTYKARETNRILELIENIVTYLTDPGGNDTLAMLVGSLGPCITAAWWEEALYRGFVTKSLNAFLYPMLAIPIASLLFAAHHMNVSNFHNLFILGMIWGLLNLNYDNIVVPMSIHSMWNTRIFMSSILGI